MTWQEKDKVRQKVKKDIERKKDENANNIEILIQKKIERERINNEKKKANIKIRSLDGGREVGWGIC